VDPPLAKPPEMVLIVLRKGGSVGVTSVSNGCKIFYVPKGFKKILGVKWV